MNIFIFASTLIVAIIVAIAIKTTDSKSDDYIESFWERESLANFSRKKNIDSLDYITIPEMILQLDYSSITSLDDSNATAVNTLLGLKDARILNLTGKTNTDLKLEYGAANITALSEYDQNHASLIASLDTIAKALVNIGDITSAQTVLEYAIDAQTDMSSSYIMLANIYINNNCRSRVEELKAKATALGSSTSNIILRHLNEL